MQKKSIFDPVTKIGRQVRRFAVRPESFFIGAIVTCVGGLGFIGYMGVQDEMQRSARAEDARKLESLDRLVADKEDGASVSIISENAVLFTLDGPHVSFLFDLNDQFVIARGSSGDSTPVASSLEAFNNPGMVNRAVAMACKTAAQVDKLPPAETMANPDHAQYIETMKAIAPAFAGTYCGGPKP